jgi:hypothetical protein
MGLLDIFKPAWQSKNKEKALKAVERKWKHLNYQNI